MVLQGLSLMNSAMVSAKKHERAPCVELDHIGISYNQKNIIQFYTEAQGLMPTSLI